MKKLTPIISFLILAFLTLPIFASADVFRDLTSICSGPDCHFESLIKFVKAAITALVVIATIVTVLALIFMGFELMMSQGNPSALTKVKGQAWAILKGYFWILAAWLIVYTIMSALTKDKYILLGNPK